MDLTIIILSWNTSALLNDALSSISVGKGSLDIQTIVVDNASDDDSVEMVRRRFPAVTLIANSSNIGFGAGNNGALSRAVGRYVLFLNSDTILTERALETMVRFADANADIGILGPKLLNADGSLQYSCRHFPNLGTGFYRNTPLGRLFPNNRFTDDYLMQSWDHATLRDVDWVSGAALMIRSDLVRQLQGFDEEFYMYCEDVDLCWRAGRTSIDATAPHRCWRVCYYPGATIHHLIGKSSDLAPTRMTYEFHRSQYLFYKKHYRTNTFFLIRPIIPLGIFLRSIGKLIRFRIMSWRKLRRMANAKRADITAVHADAVGNGTGDNEAASLKTGERK